MLGTLTFDWKTRQCMVTLKVFLVAGENAKPCRIRFDDVSELRLPNHKPWGHSAETFVNDQRLDGSAYVLELQSGDEISVTAQTVTLVHE